MAVERDLAHVVSRSAVPPRSHQDRSKKNFKRRLNEIYELPLPVVCHPLPAFIPHNPLSFFRIAYMLVSGLIWPPSSHLSVLYKGSFSSDTQSVHVTDSDTIRALWEKGFFGKGSLSRSDPSWLDREKRRLGIIAAQTSEDNTRARRNERRQMKYERALKEREVIEEQLREEAEAKLLSASDTTAADDNTPIESVQRSSEDPFSEATVNSFEHLDQAVVTSLTNGQPRLADLLDANGGDSAEALEDPDEEEIVLSNEEHLQLSLEETFFLVFALGVLQVFPKSGSVPLTTPELFDVCRSQSCYPSVYPTSDTPDDPFMLKYVVYHHFRSLGWVVRHGNKFSVDFLLYNRGPVFSHAEFAIIILPSYSDPYWRSTTELATRTEQKEKRDWWWFHCVNRVQAHVRKTLVMVYVDVPAPSTAEQNAKGASRNIGSILKRYKVREVVLRRWLMNRSRD